MADGVLTSSLQHAVRKLLFGTQALPKNRGHVLTPDFGMVTNPGLYAKIRGNTSRAGPD